MKSIKEYIILESVFNEIVSDIKNIISEIKDKNLTKEKEIGKAIRELLSGLDEIYEFDDISDLEADFYDKFGKDIYLVFAVRYVERRLTDKEIKKINSSFDHQLSDNLYIEFTKISRDPYIVIYQHK